MIRSCWPPLQSFRSLKRGMGSGMHIENVTHVFVILFGGLLVWMLLRSRVLGWKGYPLLLLVLQATVDLGIAPLLFDLSDYQYRSGKLYTRTHGWEALRAGGLIFLCYLMIAAGLLTVRLSGRRPAQERRAQIGEYCSLHVMRRAWYASLLLFAIGLAANMALIHMLTRSRSLAAIAYERAFFTDSSLVGSPLYHVLRLLAVLMMSGALGVVFFSGNRRRMLRIGTLAVFVSLGIGMLYGGRQSVFTGMICFLFLYKEVAGTIPVRRFASYAVLGAVVLGGLVYVRFDYLFSTDVSAVQLLRVLRTASVGYCRIDDTAWVLRTVPDVIPYTGIQNAFGSVARFVPSVSLPGVHTLYERVVEHLYAGVNPSGGIGGANYSTAAELYAWGGWLSVVVFGYFIGVCFGSIFEWQRRNSNNPFLTFLVVLVAVRVFFFGVQARMPNIIHEVGIHLLAVAVIAVLAVPSRRVVPFGLLILWSFIPALMWKVLDLDPLRVVVLGSVPLLYLWAVQSLRIAGTYFQKGHFYETACDGLRCRPV